MKKTAKITAAVFCLAAALLLIVLLVIEGGFKGQMKTIDKVCSSFSHGIYSDYSKCYASAQSEKQFDALREEYIAEWGEDFRLSADFVDRQKTDSGYTVYYKLTVYNDTSHKVRQDFVNMQKKDGKWVITNN